MASAARPCADQPAFRRGDGMGDIGVGTQWVTLRNSNCLAMILARARHLPRTVAR